MSSLALSDGDVRGLLDVIGLLPAWRAQAVPRELLQTLSDLVPCDLLTVSGQDTSRWHFFTDQDAPERATSTTEAPDAIYQEHYWESDCSYPDRTGDLASITLTSEILQLVGSGHTNRMIARRTHLSEATVRKHLENIYTRLGVGSRTAALRQVGAALPEWGTSVPAGVG